MHFVTENLYLAPILPAPSFIFGILRSLIMLVLFSKILAISPAGLGVKTQKTDGQSYFVLSRYTLYSNV